MRWKNSRLQPARDPHPTGAIKAAAALSVFLLGGVLIAQRSPSPVVLMAKIALPGVHGRLAHLAADPYHPRLFIAAAGNDTIEIVDSQTNSLLSSIRDVVEPHSICYVKSSNRLFVTNGGDGSVRIFDGTTPKLLTTLHLGVNPGTIRADPAHDRVYVAYGEGAIAVLDPNGSKIADIALKAHPESFQLAENQTRLYVNLPDTHTVAVVDTTALKVIAEWPIADGQENFALAIDEEKRRVFVACRRPSRLIVLDMDSGHALARLPTVGDADDLFYDAIHANIYVVGGRGQLAVYRQRTADQYEQLDSIATAAGTRTGLFVPEWNRFFVAVRDFGGHMAELRIYQPQ